MPSSTEPFKGAAGYEGLVRMVKVYRVTGSFKMGHQRQAFSKEFASDDEASCRERCLSIFGSKHGVARRLVTIDSIEEVAVADVQDPIVRHLAEA